MAVSKQASLWAGLIFLVLATLGSAEFARTIYLNGLSHYAVMLMMPAFVTGFTAVGFVVHALKISRRRA